MNRQRLVGFLESSKYCVIATVSPEGVPQSAFVGLTFINPTFEFVIGTSNQTRKYRNLKMNSLASITIREGSITVQCDGEAEIMEQGSKDYDYYGDVMVQSNPARQKFAEDPNQVYAVFRPNWVRYTDISAKPMIVEEESLN